MSSKLRANQRHRKDARRQGAAARFKILGLIEWSKSRGGQGHVDHARPLYEAYVERKQTEAKVLGLSL